MKGNGVGAGTCADRVERLPGAAVPEAHRTLMPASWPALLALLPRYALPAFDIDRRRAAYALLGVLLVSAAAQLVLYKSGVYTISNDESERVLLAHSLSWQNLWAPSWWPPLTKLLMGLPLELYDDLFVTPRIEVGLGGLLSLCALAFLAYRLFDNRLAAVLAAALGIFLPQRWILSVVPLSDIFGYALLLTAAGFAAGGLKSGRSADLFGASLFLMLTSAVRLEVWFIAAAWGLYLAYAALVRRELTLSWLVLHGVILSVFPLYWLAHNYLQTGSFENFSIVSRQFVDFYGPDLATAVRNNVLYRLIRDVVLSPVLAVGAAGLIYAAVYSRPIRIWALIFFVPVTVEAADMFATFSVPIGEGMRSDGIWALLLLPFAGAVIIAAAECIAQRAIARHAIIAVLTYAIVMPLITGTRLQIKIFEDVGVTLTQADLDLGHYLRDLLRRDQQGVLLDATGGLDYLNVLVTSNVPDRFVLNVDADPVETALYAGAPLNNLRHDDKAVIEKYRTDKFWSGDRLDDRKLSARGIDYILARRPDYIAALDADRTGLTRVKSFGRWVLFKRLGGPSG